MRTPTIQATSRTLHAAMILRHVFGRDPERVATEAFDIELDTVVLAALAECRAHVARHIVVLFVVVS